MRQCQTAAVTSAHKPCADGVGDHADAPRQLDTADRAGQVAGTATGVQHGSQNERGVAFRLQVQLDRGYQGWLAARPAKVHAYLCSCRALLGTIAVHARSGPCCIVGSAGLGGLPGSRSAAVCR